MPVLSPRSSLRLRTPFAAVGFSLLCLLPTVISAAEVHVAVAANFTAAMREIVAQFEEATPHRAIVSYGSTGKLY
ncbi:MAG: hypothetical protein HQL48_11830, partial [Gammaproteobacteria bacterium]|nr:hypothetical protein [Gammaproteobacteria bacterium]